MGVVLKEHEHKEFGNLGKAHHYKPPSDPLNNKRLEMKAAYTNTLAHNNAIINLLTPLTDDNGKNIPKISIGAGSNIMTMNESGRNYILSIIEDITKINTWMNNQYSIGEKSQNINQIDSIRKDLEFCKASTLCRINSEGITQFQAIIKLFPNLPEVLQEYDTILRYDTHIPRKAVNQHLQSLLINMRSPADAAAKARENRVSKRLPRQQGGGNTNVSKDPSVLFYQTIERIVQTFVQTMLQSPNEQSQFIFQTYGVTPDDFVFAWLRYCYDIDDLQDDFIIQDFIETFSYTFYILYIPYFQHIGYTCLNEEVLTFFIMNSVLGKDVTLNEFKETFFSLPPVLKEQAYELQQLHDCLQDSKNGFPFIEEDTFDKIAKKYNEKRNLYERSLQQSQQNIENVQAIAQKKQNVYVELNTKFPYFHNLGYLNGSAKGIVHMIQNLLKLDIAYNKGFVSGEIFIGNIPTLATFKDVLLKYPILITPLPSDNCASGFCRRTNTSSRKRKHSSTSLSNNEYKPLQKRIHVVGGRKKQRNTKTQTQKRKHKNTKTQNEKRKNIQSYVE